MTEKYSKRLHYLHIYGAVYTSEIIFKQWLYFICKNLTYVKKNDIKKTDYLKYQWTSVSVKYVFRRLFILFLFEILSTVWIVFFSLPHFSVRNSLKLFLFGRVSLNIGIFCCRKPRKEIQGNGKNNKAFLFRLFRKTQTRAQIRKKYTNYNEGQTEENKSINTLYHLLRGTCVAVFFSSSCFTYRLVHLYMCERRYNGIIIEDKKRNLAETTLSTVAGIIGSVKHTYIKFEKGLLCVEDTY